MEIKRETVIEVENRPYVVMGVLNKFGVEYCALSDVETGKISIFAKSNDTLYPVTDELTITIMLRFFSSQIARTTESMANIIMEEKETKKKK